MKKTKISKNVSKHRHNKIKIGGVKTPTPDIEMGKDIIIEPIRKMPLDEIALQERILRESLKPITKEQAEMFFERGPLEQQERKQMRKEDIESAVQEYSVGMDPFGQEKGGRKSKKNKRKTIKRRSIKRRSIKRRSIKSRKVINKLMN
jgi:hypothetical protein